MILLRAFRSAVSFLTRLPLSAQAAFPPGALGLSVAFFPFVGILLGAIAGGVAWTIRDRLEFPPHPAWALLLVALHAFLTGALHLDGLSDVADGLGGSRGNRERALQIMKDPHPGAFGVVALVLLLLGKVIVMDEVLRREGVMNALIAFPMAARLAVVPLIVFFPCARPTGLARTFHDESGWVWALLAAAFSAGTLACLGIELVVPTAIALGVSLLAGVWISFRLGGLTGDAYGTAIELAELAFLAAVALPGIRGG